MTEHMENENGNTNTLHNLLHNKVKLNGEKFSKNGYGSEIHLSGADRLAKKLYDQQQNKANEL